METCSDLRIFDLLAYCSSAESRFHRETIEYSKLTEYADPAGRLLAALHLELAAAEEELFWSLQMSTITHAVQQVYPTPDFPPYQLSRAVPELNYLIWRVKVDGYG